jgi:FkbM family methyltransferase
MALSDEPHRDLGLKRVIQKAVRLVGLHVGRYPPVDSLAYHLGVVFRELKVNCVLDIGGHTGEYGLFLRELGYRGAIISFEPVRDCFDDLAAACSRDGNWRAENFAIGPDEGELEINVCRGSVFNSFLKPSAAAPARFRRDTEVVRTEKVKVRRLQTTIDELLALHADTRLFVKVDTQGFDLEVLKSAGPSLSNIRALQTELAARATYDGMPMLPEALSQLSGLGFELTGIFPVAREMDHLRVIEFDCVMCQGARSAASNNAGQARSPAAS